MEKNEEYKSLVLRYTPKSSTAKNALRASLGGGAICLIGEGLSSLFIYMGADSKDAYLYVTLFFIFIGSSLTALGIFDSLSNLILAGALVPVTGFSNALTSSAMDASCDGHTVGVGAKIFGVCGPVILFATVGGFLYGFIYFFVDLFLK